MDQSTFPWQRFWCFREGRILLDDDGFLTNPGSEWGQLLNPDLRPVDLLAAARCLVLLGEPGSGKSTTLKTEHRAILPSLAEDGKDAIWLDLYDVGSDAQLWRHLFDTPEFAAWTHSERDLYLFLDSLDECRVQIKTLPSLLIRELRRCPVDRLHLRIACRTADWPASLENGLRDLWGDDAIEVYELAPLRRADVRLAATAVDIDADAFIESVRHSGAVPLAIKPLTLNFLLRTFRRRGSLPAQQVKLYSEGCLLLCEESEGRLELRLPRQLEGTERFAVAARIAALTVFTNRAAVWTGSDCNDVPDDDVLMGDLSGGAEAINGNPFTVDLPGVEEALNTGLFSSRGQHRLGWAHRTYAEFLAAHYIVKHELSLPQIMSLIVHSGDAHGKLVPQLYETAAWLAAMRSDVFHAILARDPDVVLRSDLGSATEADRSALVAALLGASDAGDWVDRDWGLRQFYAKLRHSSLAAQLRPYISDPSKGPVVRRVAADIAEACEERSLLGDLVATALDASTPLHTRINSAYAVVRIGDEEHRRRLRSLINTSTEIDPDGELKGCGLQATWPGILSTAELLAALTPPPTNLMGAYRSFLYDNPIRHLTAEDLPLAIRWAQEHADRATIHSEINDVVDAIMRHAWHHVEDPEISEGFGRIALLRIRRMRPILDPDSLQTLILAGEQSRRRALATVVVAADGDDDLRLIEHNGLVLLNDAMWLLEQYTIKPDPHKGRWAFLLRDALHPDDRVAVDAALTARETDLRLRAILAPLFDPIPLNSAEAVQQRELYQMMAKLQARDSHNQSKSQVPLEDRIEPLLNRLDAGDLSAWWQLNVGLAQEPGSTHDVNEFESDLTVSPGWRDADSETRGALVVAADKYVRGMTPEPTQWISSLSGQITIYRPDWAGFRAIRLLLAEAPALLANLPEEVWAQWAPVIVAYPVLNLPRQGHPHQQLMAYAYRHAPSEVLFTLDQLIDLENRREHPFPERLVRLVAECWDDRLAEALLVKTQERDLSPAMSGQLLEALMDHGFDAAIPVALSFVPLPLPTNLRDRWRAVVMAALLLQQAPDAAWSTVWTALQSDHAFAEEVLGHLVWTDRLHTGAVATLLTDEQVADLYIWLSRHYPPDQDPEIDGKVEFRGAVGQWRGGLLTQLKRRGTLGACGAIERIVAALPDQEWLNWTLLEARTLTRQRTWVPPRPDDIRTLVQAAEQRFVQNADQLLDVVVESLGRLEEKLQRTEPPRAIELWNEEGTKFRPKNEERLSNYLKGHLDDDLRDCGVIFNREVENRRGELTDIRVEAFQRDADGQVVDLLAVIIEVKGCWNQHLASAMETQLVGQYLSGTNTNHGLYVVGWYNCDIWDQEDWRFQRAPKYDQDEAQRLLDAQALALSRDGKHVRALVVNTSLRH